MYRNAAMYYFNSNRPGEAVSEMSMAINIAENIKNESLRAYLYSDLGSMHCYNHDFLKAKECYKRVEALLLFIDADELDILFLHNYRFGLLYSDIHEDELARQYFEQALTFADSPERTGNTMLNMGIAYKRQRNLKMALQHYQNALEAYERNDYLNRSMVYNNIADLYKIYGQYEKALQHIELAFSKLGSNDTARLFTYFRTYTEIMILMGNPDQVFNRFLEVLYQVKDMHLYKNCIAEGINDMALIASESKEMLDRLEEVISRLISSAKCEYKEYIKELKACQRNIGLYKYDLRKQKSYILV